MPRFTRPAGRALACLISGSLLVAMAPGAAADPSIGASTSLRSWDCTRGLTWRGSIMPTSSPGDISHSQTRGTYDICTWVWRIKDSDRDNDYYAIAVGVEWKTQPGTRSWDDNPGSLVVTSRQTATAFDASDTVTGTSCKSGVSVGLGAGPFSASVTPVLCKKHTLWRTRMNERSARWHSGDVSKTPKWESMYIHRVGQGVKPTYTVTLRWPDFRAYYEYGRNIMRYSKYYGETKATYGP